MGIASSFYGNMKNNSRSSFIIDKIYPSRAAMEAALKNQDPINPNKIVGDGIFLPFQLQDGAAVYQMFTGDGLTFLEFGFGNDGTITFYGPTYYPLNAEENAPIDPGTQFS